MRICPGIRTEFVDSVYSIRNQESGHSHARARAQVTERFTAILGSYLETLSLEKQVVGPRALWKSWC